MDRFIVDRREMVQVEEDVKKREKRDTGKVKERDYNNEREESKRNTWGIVNFCCNVAPLLAYEYLE